MEKKEIIKRFSEQGFLLSPEVLEKINEKNADTILENARKTGEFIITSPEEPELSYRIRRITQLKKLSPQDVIKYYNNRHEGIKNILLRKIDALSINKARTTYSAGIIGMVKDKTPEGFIAEDPTGEIEVRSKANIALDDVVGVKGFVRNNVLFAEEVIWPDIPLTHHVGKIEDVMILLTTQMTKKIKNEMNSVNFVITPRLNSNSPKTITNFPNPAWITFSKKAEQMIIFIYQIERAIKTEQVIEWLKKRHIINEKNEILSNEDYFLLEPLPDIMWFISNNEPWVENYKGITLISFKEKNYATINLGTREVKIEKNI